MAKRQYICQVCYVGGHNARTCPRRSTAYIPKEKKEKKPTNCRCSYCREIGHTTRTCCELKEDSSKLDRLAHAQFSRVSESLSRTAPWLHPGSLITIQKPVSLSNYSFAAELRKSDKSDPEFAALLAAAIAEGNSTGYYRITDDDRIEFSSSFGPLNPMSLHFNFSYLIVSVPENCLWVDIHDNGTLYHLRYIKAYFCEAEGGAISADAKTPALFNLINFQVARSVVAVTGEGRYSYYLNDYCSRKGGEISDIEDLDFRTKVISSTENAQSRPSFSFEGTQKLIDSLLRADTIQRKQNLRYKLHREIENLEKTVTRVLP